MYNAAEYPEGVPNPQYPDVNLYPTYGHGPDYTRPVFGQPFEPMPFNVLSGVGADPYGNAPRTLPAFLPQVNRFGDAINQPQPNPYFAHWTENMGGLGETGGSGKTIFAVIAVAAVGVAAYWMFFHEPAGDYEVQLVYPGGKRHTSRSFYTLGAARAYAHDARKTGKWEDIEVLQKGAA